MPTYEDPKQDAAEFREAARGLAYATRQFESLPDTYEVLGDLQYGLNALEQVLRQLASFHLDHAGEANTDRGNWAAGAAHSTGAAAWLTTAAALVEDAATKVRVAHVENGHIAWRPGQDPKKLAEELAAREQALDPDTTSREDLGPVAPSLSR